MGQGIKKGGPVAGDHLRKVGSGREELWVRGTTWVPTQGPTLILARSVAAGPGDSAQSSSLSLWLQCSVKPLLFAYSSH